MTNDEQLSDDAVLGRLFSSQNEARPLTARPRDAPLEVARRPLETPAQLGGFVGDNVTVYDPPAGEGPPPRRAEPVGNSFLPFQVIAPSTPSPSEVRVQVYGQSFLSQSYKPNDYSPVSGVATDFPVTVGSLIYLRAVVTDFHLSGVYLQAGVPWPNYPNPADYSGEGTIDSPFEQTAFYVLIAQCVDANSSLPGTVFSAGNNKVKVVQKLRSDLILFPTVEEGRPLLYVTAHGAPQS